ncbi:MAG: DJ-1/PfpI family protein [Blastocatellia bacterium]|nr:DJ-1/PfpI family protein [Blastocatellia bacterium]
MNIFSLFKMSLMAALIVFFGMVAMAHPTINQDKHYVCPPCNMPCDKEIHDKPGICPTCKMPLVESTSKEAEAPIKKQVAILIFDDVEIIDYTGPYEMFGVAGFEVFTVAATKKPIRTYLGMIVTPNYSFSDAPKADILVIPGGGVNDSETDEATLTYIKETSLHAENIMSVCNGAFILANTGLLNGLHATTTRGNIPRLSRKYPKVTVVRDQRYTDNGKIITTGGLSAGIDGALHIIERILGTDVAKKIAYLEEYNWQPGTTLPKSLMPPDQK